MITYLCALAAAAVIAAVAVLLLGWGGILTRVQRIGLAAMAAGLVWAAIPRLFGKPPGLGDLLFLAGIGLYLGGTYGVAIWKRADALDGTEDGKVEVIRRGGQGWRS